MDILTGFPFNDEWKRDRRMTYLVDLMRRLTSVPVSDDMNQYRKYTAQWPIALEALRKLWETGKVSQLKSPFYERIETK